MFCLVCVCVLFLTLLGAYYSRNRSSYIKEKITTHKNYIINGKKNKKRVLSLFNTGLNYLKEPLIHITMSLFLINLFYMIFKLN